MAELGVALALILWGPVLASVATLCAWAIRLFRQKARRHGAGGVGPSLPKVFLYSYVTVVVIWVLLIYTTEYFSGGTRP